MHGKLPRCPVGLERRRLLVRLPRPVRSQAYAPPPGAPGRLIGWTSGRAAAAAAAPAARLTSLGCRPSAYSGQADRPFRPMPITGARRRRVGLLRRLLAHGQVRLRPALDGGKDLARPLAAMLPAPLVAGRGGGAGLLDGIELTDETQNLPALGREERLDGPRISVGRGPCCFPRSSTVRVSPSFTALVRRLPSFIGAVVDPGEIAETGKPRAHGSGRKSSPLPVLTRARVAQDQG